MNDLGAQDMGGEVDMAGELDMGGGNPDDAGTADMGADSGSPPPPDDAGRLFDDGGSLGEPEWVEITVLTDGSSCPDLVPCGGDVVGTWDITGGCVEAPVPSELGLCRGAMVTGRGRARGRVTFDARTVRRTAQSEVTVTLQLPAVCASLAGGCAAIERRVRMSARGADVTCRMSSAGDCDCDIRQVETISDGNTYTIEGNQVVTPAKRYDYCISGDVMRYEDVSPSGMREPGIMSLGRRR